MMEKDRFTAVTPGKDERAHNVLDNKNSKKFRDMMVNRAVGDYIYPAKKFILLEEEMAYGGKLQKKVFKNLEGVPKEETRKEALWDTVKEAVRNKLNRRRNNVQYEMRKKMAGK